MQVNTGKLRHLILGTQLLAGIGLLTASYMTTDASWSEQLVNNSAQAVQFQKVVRTTNLKGGC